jgi:hypothetical protein
MSDGSLALFVVLSAFVAMFVLGFVLLALLTQRRWRAAVIALCGIVAAAGTGVWGADYGVRVGHWNETIHAHCLRDSPPGTRCP